MDAQTVSGALIDAHRRKPVRCLYCDDVVLTDEHIVPEAIGGRLTARILCSKHNGLVNAGADEPLSKNFAPYVTMLQIRRHRGETGAEFTATGGDGNPVVIVPDGFAKELPLIVKKRDEDGRILYAEGDLSKLDRLPVDAFSNRGQRNVIAKITAPEAQFAVASDDRIRPGILKMALHFVAGYIAWS